MNSRLNKTLERIDSLSPDKQANLIEFEKKRTIEKKRKILLTKVQEAQMEIEKGDYVTGNYEDVMKAIDDETKHGKKVQKGSR